MKEIEIKRLERAAKFLRKRNDEDYAAIQRRREVIAFLEKEVKEQRKLNAEEWKRIHAL